MNRTVTRIDMAVADRASPAQIGAIHALAKKAGMDEDTRRDFLARETGERSSAVLSRRQAIGVIDKLRTLADGGVVKAKGAVAGLDTPVAKKMRALWIAAYDLGLVRDRTDKAMLSFLERQTKVSHTRFLSSPGEASSAIEALKSWLARDGKVEWPARESWKKDGKADFEEIAAAKLAILNAQLKMLHDAKAVKKTESLLDVSFPIVRRLPNDWELTDFDTVQREFGRRLRALSKGART